MKSFDFDLNKPPQNDNNVPEAGPSNPIIQGGQSICLPVFRFELGCMPPGHPSPRPIEAEELDAFDVVGFRNYDTASVRFFRDFNYEPQGGPTTPLARGRQPLAPVEPTLWPLGSTSSRPSDVQELYDDDGDDDNNEDNHDNVDVNGDNYVLSSPTTFDHELERGPTNPMAQVGQPAIQHVHVAPVERSLQPQGSPPRGPVDVVDLVSDDEHVDNHEDEGDDDDDDSEDDDNDDDDDGDDYNDDDEEEEEEEDYDDGYSVDSYNPDYNGEDVAAGDDVAAEDDDVVISSPIDLGQASSSRTTQGMTSLIDSESVRIADNHLRNVRRRVVSQPAVNIRDFNVDLGETRSSMPDPVAPPPLPPPAPTINCPTCMRPPEASSSMPKPVAPLPPAPPHLPALECPICMGPLVAEMTTRCGHVFCEGCIKAAFAVEAKCPICRCKVAYRELTRIYLPVGN